MNSKGISDIYPELSDSVSEVDVEDMAKMLKGADDIDDELFGFSKNKSPQQLKKPTQTSSFENDREKHKKAPKKVGFSEFDDSDPLGDISLSDDDFYGIKKDKAVTPSDGLKSNASATYETSGMKRPESSPADLKDKSTKSKLIKDLFGLDNDTETAVNQSPQAASVVNENKKSDWLGIKESPIKGSSDDFHLTEESDKVPKNDVLSPVFTGKINEDIMFSANKQLDLSSVSDNKNLDQIDVKKKDNDTGVPLLKKQESFGKYVTKESKIKDRNPLKKNFSLDLNKKDLAIDNDDIFDLLDDNAKVYDDKLVIGAGKKQVGKTVSDKKVEITDELFGKGSNKTTFSTPGDNKSQIKDIDIFNKSFADSVGNTTASSDNPGLGQYMPSSGSARRPGFGRRRGSGSLPNSASPKRTLDSDANWLSGSNKTDQENAGEKGSGKVAVNQPIRQSTNFILGLDSNVTQTDSLPSWLGGEKKEKIDFNDKKVASKIQSSSLVDIGSDVKTRKQQVDQKEVQQTDGTEVTDKNVKTDSTVNIGDSSSNQLEKEVISKQNDESQLAGEVLSASSALSQQSVNVMRQTESQLLSIMQMKQQQDMIKDLCNRQKQLLVVQQQQIEQLVKQQVTKQLKIDEQMKIQQERINTLMQSLMSEAQKPILDDFNANVVHLINNNNNSGETIVHSTDLLYKNPAATGHDPIITVSSSAIENEHKNIITELEVSLNKLKIENASLQQSLESVQARHAEELKNIEEFHKNEVLHFEKREERLKQSEDDLRKDYEARIARLQENELKLIEQHEIRMDNLQKERLADLRQVGEFHRLAMEQVASVGKMLFEDVRIIENKRAIEASKPLDESQLSARELALLKKEKEISALKDSLEKQLVNLMAEKEEVEERLEVEKRQYEEKLRQLKREQNALKMREEEFLREQEREKELLKMQKKQIEELREKALIEQTKAVEERLQVTASQARLETLAKFHGGEDSTIASFDLVQARAELQGAMKAATEEKQRADEEKRKLKQQNLALEGEKWKLQEWEQEVITKTKFVEDLIKASEAKKEEGLKALAEAKQLEKKFEIRNRDIQNQINDLNVREERLMKEKLELAKERAILDKRRAQLETLLPPLSPSESFSLGIPTRNFIDPKKLIMKLKAEKEYESLMLRS